MINTLSIQQPFTGNLKQGATYVEEASAKKPIRILLVDQSPVVRYGLNAKLKAESEFDVVGEAGTCCECCGKIAVLCPDVVLVDLDLNDISGLDAFQKIRKASPKGSLIIYAAHKSDLLILETINIGIQGFVMKAAPTERIVHAIRAIGQGESYLDPLATSMVMDYMQQKNEPSRFKQRLLTHREAAILAVLATGKSNKEIADWGAMSESTTKHHVSMIFQKLNTSSRTEAVVTAIKLGLIDISRKTK